VRKIHVKIFLHGFFSHITNDNTLLVLSIMVFSSHNKYTGPKGDRGPVGTIDPKGDKGTRVIKVRLN
jgi:hypothetical protein